MPESELRFVRRSAEFLDSSKVSQLKSGLRGIYVLYREQTKRRKKVYDVQYVGMATGRIGFKSRLRSHKKLKKEKSWTHFSIFEVWDNVTNREVAELEGMARHIYRRDSTASTLNIQRGYKKLRRVKNNRVDKW
jgi:hypothetical protein